MARAATYAHMRARIDTVSHTRIDMAAILVYKQCEGCYPRIYPMCGWVYPKRTPVAWVFPRRKSRINPSMGQLMVERGIPNGKVAPSLQHLMVDESQGLL